MEIQMYYWLSKSRKEVLMGSILGGAILIVIGIWIHGNWERIAESDRVKILRRSNRMACFLLFNLLPAMVLAFPSAATMMGIYAGIHNLPDDAPITFSDGFFFVLFSAFYCFGLYGLLPFPFGVDGRPVVIRMKSGSYDPNPS